MSQQSQGATTRAHVSPRPTQGNGWGFFGHEGFNRRGGEAFARKRTAAYHIEGETLTLAELAVRLGVSERSARRKLQQAQAADGPVTWEALR